MYIKKLSFLISKVLVTGCVSFALTGTASAYSNGYWQGLSPAKFGQYKFRPLDNQRQVYKSGAQPGTYQKPMAQARQVFSRFEKPSFPNMLNGYAAPVRFTMPRLMPLNRSNPRGVFSPAQVLAENNRYFQPGRYSRDLKPAFTKQYGWTPATKMTVRKGGGSDHFASEINSAFSRFNTQEGISEYRTEPVTQQGFRYRTFTRNPGHVSFADKLRHLAPQTTGNTFRQDSRVELPAQNWQKPEPAALPAAPVSPSVNNRLVQVNTSGYRFRPDERFESQSAPVFNQHVNVDAMSADDFRLVNARIETNNPDSSSQWFFRPSQPTSF